MPPLTKPSPALLPPMPRVGSPTAATLRLLNPFEPRCQYQACLRANLREPGRFEALRAMIAASKAPCEARIPEVKCRTLVLMGTQDPDFADPAMEARLVAQRLSGELSLVEGAGHYPHVEVSEQVATRILAFLESHASSWT